MRMGLRLAFWLITGITCVSLLFAVYQVEVEYQGRRSELKRRAEILADSLQESVEHLRGVSTVNDLQRLVDRFGNREHLVGIVVVDEIGAPIAMTSTLPERVDPQARVVEQAALHAKESGEFIKSKGTPIHVYAVPVRRNGGV